MSYRYGTRCRIGLGEVGPGGVGLGGVRLGGVGLSGGSVLSPLGSANSEKYCEPTRHG